MKFSNTYIFVFSVVMVIIVATILSFSSLQLQDRQDRNVEIEKMKNILASVNIESNDKTAENLYSKYITKNYVINTNAKKVDSIKAFDVDMKKELEKITKIKKLKQETIQLAPSPLRKWLSGFINFSHADTITIFNKIEKEKNQRMLPVYVCEKNDSNYYVFPMRGKGLWGPIWGYIALSEDFNAIYGANFDHKSETPGLGAEINEQWFQDMFKGKNIFNEQGKFVSVEVMKGGAPDDAAHAVDAISGGTITSNGLENMIMDCLAPYQAYFEKNK